MAPVGGLTLRDLSGYGNDGALNNMEATDWQTTPFGGWSLDFGGTDEYVRVPNNNSFDPVLGRLTVSGWFRTATSGIAQYVISRRDDSLGGVFPFWFVRVESSNVLRFFLASTVENTQDIESTTTVTDGNLHHFVAVKGAGNDIRLYLDGVSEGSPVITGSLASFVSNDDIFLATAFTGLGDPADVFIGQLFDIRINMAAFPEALAYSLYGPSTRWDLYHELGRVSYLFLPSVTDTFDTALLGSSSPRWDRKMRIY